MKMLDRKIMDSFKEEWEIPDSVTGKMQEAYRRIGAKETGAAVPGCSRSRRAGRRYLKAASFVAAALILGVTAGAAAGINEPLKKLFQKDSGLARESSSVPDTKAVHNTLGDLNVEIESISGTDEMAYIMLHVQRKDGGNFDKNKVYNFGNVNIWDVPSESVSLGEMDSSSESGSSFMLENEGTSELRIVYQTLYERTVGGRREYRKGKQCRIRLKNLVAESEQGCNSVEMSGELELSFKMEYGDAPVKTKDTDVNISFPLCDSEEYILRGRLQKVTITPYYVQYKLKYTEPDSENKDYYDQVYVEMDDGSFMGYRTEEDVKGRWSYSMVATSGGFYDRDRGCGEFEGTVFLPKLIDVKHVRAVYFGKTRIEMN